MLTEPNQAFYRSAFTVDVEDGVSIAMRDVFETKVPQTHRVVENTKKIIDLLAKYNVKGTFFILGQVAEEFPNLIKDIADEGHEIGVHGYNHLQFFRMTPTQAREELSRAKNLLEDLTGQSVEGHRAPAFSVNSSTAWALDVIAECGFQYDSSIIPLKGKRYGWPGFPQNIVRIHTSSGNSIIEVPISTVKLLNNFVAFSGGGYLRLFPFQFTKWAFKKTLQRRPSILYVHPYELDTVPYPDYYFEALRKSSLLKQMKMRSYWVKRGTVIKKLEELIRLYPFSSMKELIKSTSNKPISDLYIETLDGKLSELQV